MTVDQIERFAEDESLNPYYAAWLLCGSPRSEFWGDLPWMFHFKEWNDMHWKTTSKRTGWPPPCTPEEHLITLADAVKAHALSKEV